MQLIKKQAAALLLLAFAVGSPQAFAASYIDAGVASSFTQYSADVSTLAGYAWPVILAVLGIMIAIKLVKRFAHKV